MMRLEPGEPVMPVDSSGVDSFLIHYPDFIAPGQEGYTNF